MASNGLPPKHEMSKATSPPPPIKRAVAIAVRERISVRMDAGNIVATGLLGLVLASDGSNLEGPE
jgi:hypothetical protein